MSNENIFPSFTTSKSLSTKLVWYNYKIKLKFEGSCLKREDKAAFTPWIVLNVFIVYELNSWPRNLNTDLTFGGCLFGSIKLTKNTDPDKYSHSSYGIGFDTQIEYSLPEGSVGKNVIIFRADMSSSVHVDNKGKDILILGKGITQELMHKWAAEVLYSINFTRPGIKFYLSLYYNGSSSFLFLDATKIYQFKVKVSENKKISIVFRKYFTRFSS